MSVFEIYKSESKNTDPDECYRWRLEDNNHEIIAQSGEDFWLNNIEISIKVIQEQAPNAPVWKDESQQDKDQGYRFEYYQSSEDQQWYWRFRSGNNKSLASGEGYSSESSIKKAIENIQLEMGRAKIENKFKDQQKDRTKKRLPPGS